MAQEWRVNKCEEGWRWDTKADDDDVQEEEKQQ